MSAAPRTPLARAARRAALHIVKANIEVLKAVEAVIEELRRVDEPPPDRPKRITVE